MPDRGPVARCTVRACPFVGHFAAYEGLCPEHRGEMLADARRRRLHEELARLDHQLDQEEGA